MAKRGTLTHWKTQELAELLQIPLPYAFGLLEALWHATTARAPDGAIGKMPNRAIARELFWPGDPDALVEALIGAGWLEHCDEHRLIVHDWHEHCDNAVHMALARARKFFANGEKPTTTKLGGREREAADEFFGTASARRAHGERTKAHGERTAPPRPAPPRHKEEDLHTHTAREGGDDPLDLGMGADPDEPPPAQPTNEARVSVVAAKRAPIADDFSPSEANTAKAAFYELDLDRELDEFVAHARDNGRESADWQAAFARWLNKSAAMKQSQRRTGPTRASPGRFAADRTTDAIAEVIEEARRHDEERARKASG